jgi:hypothetical protein
VRHLLGNDLHKVAALAVRAILANRRSLEIAHQQIKYRKHHIAFSSRINAWGDLVVELDVSNPRFQRRLAQQAAVEALHLTYPSVGHALTATLTLPSPCLTCASTQPARLRASQARSVSCKAKRRDSAHEVPPAKPSPRW